MNTSLAGQKVKVLIDDIEFIGVIIATGSKFPTIFIGRYSFEVDYNLAYKAVYMNHIIRV